MKREFLIFGSVIMMAAAGCSANGNFSDEELDLINEGDKDVMRVLKMDAPEDTVLLRMKSIDVPDKVIQSDEYELLCDRMLKTVQAPENDGVGIAGPQVGILRRVVAVRRFDKKGEPFEFYANPEIIRYGSNTAPGGEGCLSVPDMRGMVERSQEIDVRYRTLSGADTVETVKGFTAVIFQHEIDHLDGIIYTDRATVTGNDHMETRVMEDGSRITWIQDNSEPRMMPASLFPEADAALMKNLGLENGIPSSVSVFLLEKNGLRILFDAGNGGEDSELASILKQMNLSCDDVDYVYVTHLHGDHIGGMIHGEEPAFPNAVVYIAERELGEWMSMPEDNNGKLRKVVSAYEGRIKLFMAGDILPGDVETIEAHGHTPGHTVYRSGNLLIVGDILHGAALQMEHPEICAAFDMDKKAAVSSRRKILEYASENGLTMCGMHFPAPAFK